MSVGQHLRRLRETAGLSRAELARRATVPAGAVRNWEGDRGFPDLPAGRRLAAALGVPAERFAEGVDDPAAEPALEIPHRRQKGRRRERTGKSSPGRGGGTGWAWLARPRKSPAFNGLVSRRAG
jgi:transcriptional regulator with XRE-family HTH domain